MTNRDLMALLLKHPMDSEVTIDLDDGLDGNYMPVLGVIEKENTFGKFIVIEADIKRN